VNGRTKEELVREVIYNNFEGFLHDRPIMYGCCDKRRRIDFRKQIRSTLLAVEFDENQHKYYNAEDEEIRYHDIYLATGVVQKMLFIRFNPDKYIDSNGVKRNGMLDSTAFLHKQEVRLRTNVLVEEMKRHILRIEKEENSELNEIHKLFYNWYMVKK